MNEFSLKGRNGDSIADWLSWTRPKKKSHWCAGNVGLFERGERVGLLAAGAILGFVVPALWILLIGSTVTLAQRFVRAYREMGRLDAEERTNLEDRSLRKEI